MWSDFWYWMTEREGWKIMAALVYFAICIFDFIIMPTWLESNKPDISVVIANLPTAGETVQLQYMQVLTTTHQPMTLQGGGLFHLAMGALLTGAAVVRNPMLEGGRNPQRERDREPRGGIPQERRPRTPVPAGPGLGSGKAQDDDDDAN